MEKDSQPEIPLRLTITLSPDAEAALTDQARERGPTPVEYAAGIVSQTVLPPLDSPPPKQGTAEWMAEFKARVASHEPVNRVVDDSRETIYGGPEGRGE